MIDGRDQQLLVISRKCGVGRSRLSIGPQRRLGLAELIGQHQSGQHENLRLADAADRARPDELLHSAVDHASQFADTILLTLVASYRVGPSIDADFDLWQCNLSR